MERIQIFSQHIFNTILKEKEKRKTKKKGEWEGSGRVSPEAQEGEHQATKRGLGLFPTPSHELPGAAKDPATADKTQRDPW